MQTLFGEAPQNRPAASRLLLTGGPYQLEV